MKCAHSFILSAFFSLAVGTVSLADEHDDERSSCPVFERLTLIASLSSPTFLVVSSRDGEDDVDGADEEGTATLPPVKFLELGAGHEGLNCGNGSAH